MSILNKQTAYEKWLGIKIHDQPPTLYRLLGVDVFEPDPDTISYAADSRMTFLRQFQIGDNAPLAEEILNEVSNARVTLLNTEKKSTYDARLRTRTTARTAAAASSGTPSSPTVAAPLRRAESIAAPTRPSPAPSTPTAIDLDSMISEARTTAPKASKRGKKGSKAVMGIAAGSAVVLVIMAIAFVNSLSSNDGPPPAVVPTNVATVSERPKPPAQAIGSNLPATRLPNDSAAPKVSSNVPRRPSTVLLEPKTVAPSPAPIAVASNETPKPESRQATPSLPAERPKAPVAVAADTAEPAQPEEPALVPVPDAAAQAGAIKLVKDVYGKQWAAARTAEGKQVLAKELLEKASESQSDRLAQFVLLRLAKELSAQASDCEVACEAIEETGTVFQVDALEMKVDALRKCASAATTSDQHAAVAEKATETSGQAVVAENFAVAKPLVDLALGEARKAKDETLIKQCTERKIEAEKTAQIYEAARRATATIETTPFDADANLALGMYKCFAKSDWQSGLPKLAIGSDPTWKALAEAELKGATSSQDQAKLGDLWWHAAESRKGVERKAAQSRAGFWYQQAVAGLNGIQKDIVEKRLAESKEAAEASWLAPNLKDKWVLLFRSADPSVWNTNSGDKDRFAIPLANAPDRIRFLKVQISPKDYVIISMTNDKLGKVDTRETIGWQGTNYFIWGGHELGVFDPTKNAHAEGACAMAWRNGSEYSGWGFGYSNRQGYCWNRIPIGKTVFEISVTPFKLTTREKQHLLK